MPMALFGSHGAAVAPGRPLAALRCWVTHGRTGAARDALLLALALSPHPGSGQLSPN